MRSGWAFPIDAPSRFMKLQDGRDGKATFGTMRRSPFIQATGLQKLAPAEARIPLEVAFKLEVFQEAMRRVTPLLATITRAVTFSSSAADLDAFMTGIIAKRFAIAVPDMDEEGDLRPIILPNVQVANVRAAKHMLCLE